MLNTKGKDCKNQNDCITCLFCIRKTLNVINEIYCNNLYTIIVSFTSLIYSISIVK